MGKAYANRKPVSERPEQDFYSTPYPLTWELLKLNEFNKRTPIYEPADGSGAISSQLEKAGFKVYRDDIRTTGKDFLDCKEKHPAIITNPPFSLWTEFVDSARGVSDKWAFIGKTNFFGTYNRYKDGVWKNLSKVYVFNRQLDYRSPLRDDGAMHVGNLITGWFIWDKSWKKDYWRMEIMDIQKYCTLGGIK